MPAMRLALGTVLAGVSHAYSGMLGSRYVEQPMARLPSIRGAQLDVRMLGQDVNGSHVVGHLVKLANPQGRVSLALPPLGCGSRELTTVTAMAHRPACRLAINAGYFNVHNGACIGNVASHGSLIQSVPLSQGNVNFGVKDGRFVIGYLTQEEMAGFDLLVSGVVWLVRDGVNYVQQGWAEANITVQTSGEKYATALASRTAVGYDKQGRLIVVQIDGSIAVGVGRGMNMAQLADLLIKHGAVNAINLDGGGSSSMARDGVLVNYPSDMKPPSCDPSGLYQCERPVSTVLCLHEKTGEEVPLMEEEEVGLPDEPVVAAKGGSYAKTSPGPLRQHAENGGSAVSTLTAMLGGAGLFMAGGGLALVARNLVAKRRDNDDEEGFARQLSTESRASYASSLKSGRP